MKEILIRNGIFLKETQLDKLTAFCRILAEYNKKINLTAITDEKEMAVKHIADSIKGERYLPESGLITDLGSGAGFPSIPLIIAGEGKKREYVLLDSLKKRTDFLETVIKALDLKGVSVLHTRAEDEGRKSRGVYDCAVARAVAPLNILVEYALPLLKKGGTLVAYKGDPDEEIAGAETALKILGGEIVSVDKYLLDNEYARSFVIVKKVSETPDKYPRGQNKPRIIPL